MWYIAVIAVITIVALEVFGAVPDSSVGGPMTLMLIFLIAAVSLGVYEAWSKRRGFLGWIVSIVAALVGAFVAAMLGGAIMDTVLPLLQLDGSLAETRHPFLYVGSAAMMILTLAGSWLVLQVVNRWR